MLNEPTLESFTNCNSPQFYSNLGLGLRVFEVKAVFTVNGVQVESLPDTFRWRIVSITPVPDVEREASDVAQEAEATETANQLLANEGYAEGQLNVLEDATANMEAADELASFINPPFKVCDDTTDYAIYNVHGSADLGDLFGSDTGISASGDDKTSRDKTSIPIALILFNDLAPAEHKNIILNNNQPFMRAELVAFPGDPTEQISTNYEIKKVTTDCKENALVEEAQNLGSEDNVNTPDGGDSAATTTTRDKLNPPFKRCTVPEGGGAKPAGTLEADPGEDPDAIIRDSNLPGAIREDLIQSDAENVVPTTGLSEEEAAQVRLDEELAESADTTPSTLAEEEFPASGANTDVAKYIIAGTIDLNGASFEDGMQDTVIRLYNIFDPTKAPQLQTANTVNSNNLFMTAKLEASPGDTDSWEIVFIVLTEVSTECLQIPFVSSPKTIGTGGSDFFVTGMG